MAKIATLMNSLEKLPKTITGTNDKKHSKIAIIFSQVVRDLTINRVLIRAVCRMYTNR